MMTEFNCTRTYGQAAVLFETWLQLGLQRLYDRTLHEPVPDELLQLVLQSKEAGPKQ